MLKKVEVLANVAVIITSLVVCSVLVKKYFFVANSQAVAPARPSTGSLAANVPPKNPLQAGTKISLAGVDWSQSKRTLLLVLSTTCHFCTESAPFYQELQQRKPSDLRLVAVLPQSIEQSRAYLTKLGIVSADVVQSPLGSVGVSGTPTLILVDSGGSIRGSWAGRLSEVEGVNVIGQINAGD